MESSLEQRIEEAIKEVDACYKEVQPLSSETSFIALAALQTIKWIEKILESSDNTDPFGLIIMTRFNSFLKEGEKK